MKNKKILLVDVDSKIPNLALMKLSTYYNKLHYKVDFLKLNFSGIPSRGSEFHFIQGYYYDRVFISIIFPKNWKKVYVMNCDKVIYGGTGSNDIKKKLPDTIENCDCDYSLYPDNDTSYGFMTRGCIRNCYFCFVPEKEGKLKFVSKWQDLLKHDKISFLDNNFLAYKKHLKILKELVRNKIKCDFNQGLDIRLINDDNAKWLSRLRYNNSEFIFAFDHLKDKKLISKKLKVLKKYITKKRGPYRIKFFIYVHPDMPIEDPIARLKWCKKNEVLPYVMRDNSCWNSKHKQFYTLLAGYCNFARYFKKYSFEEYINKFRTKGNKKIKKEYKFYIKKWNKVKVNF